MRAAVVAEALFSSFKVYPRESDHFWFANDKGVDGDKPVYRY